MTAPLPVYLVKGDDPSLRSDAVSKLVHELVGDDDISLVVEEFGPDSDDGDTTAATDAAQTPPFLAERRVVVVRDVTTYSSEALKPLLSYLEDPLPTTSMVLVTADKGRLSTKLSAIVKQVGHLINTDVPQQSKGRSAWLSDQLHRAPVRLDSAAASLLDNHLGDGLGRLSSLLETLAAAFGEGARLGPDDIAPFLGEEGNVPPWELTDAIDHGDTPTALGALSRMMGAGERHPLQMMAVLHGHYAKMLRLDGANVVDEAAAADVLGIKGSTFPAKKALTQARRLGHEGVVEAIRLLSEADLDLRGVKAWPEELVMEVLVARLTRLGPRSRGRTRS